MLCYLFLERAPAKDSYYAIRPVSFNNHEDVLLPSVLEHKAIYLEWLANWGAMIWLPGCTPKLMMVKLKQFCGEWPEPIEVPEVKVMSDRIDDIKRFKELLP